MGPLKYKMVVVAIVLFMSLSSAYVFFSFFYQRTNLGVAYIADQLLPLAIALFVGIFALKRNVTKFQFKGFLRYHALPLVILGLIVFIVRGWILDSYFFLEEPVTTLGPIVNDRFDWVLSSLWRGYHLSIYIGSFLLFGTNLLPHNVISLSLYLVSAVELYILLFIIFNKRYVALVGVLFFVTTPSYQDFFNWQAHVSGTSLALASVLASVLALYFYQKKRRLMLYVVSLLLFAAALKISFLRLFGFVTIPVFFAFFPNFSFTLNLKRSFQIALPFVLIWTSVVLYQHLIPDIFPVLNYYIFHLVNFPVQEVVEVRETFIRFDNYHVVMATLVAYLFLPNQLTKIVFSLTSKFVDSSSTFFIGIVLIAALLLLGIFSLIKIRKRLGVLTLLAILFIFSNIFYVPLFIPDYHDLKRLDYLFVLTSAGNGPGNRYVFVSVIGMSILFSIFVGWIFTVRKIIYRIVLFSVVGIILYKNAMYSIQAHKDALAFDTWRPLFGPIFATVPRDGEGKLLISTNPKDNILDSFSEAFNWLNTFYNRDGEGTLEYVGSIDKIYGEIESRGVQRENIYAFYYNPDTLVYADVSGLLRKEILDNDVNRVSLVLSEGDALTGTLLDASEISGYKWFLKRGVFVSGELEFRSLVPMDLVINLRKGGVNYSEPYLDSVIVSSSAERDTSFPLDLLFLLKNRPIIAINGLGELNQVQSLGGVSIEDISKEKRKEIAKVLATRAFYRTYSKLSVSNIEKNNRITTDSLLDGEYTVVRSPYYRAETTPTLIDISFPYKIALGRVLLNVPPGSPANMPTKIKLSIPDQRYTSLITLENLTPSRLDQSNNGLFVIPLGGMLTDFLKINVLETTGGPVMLNEIVFDSPNAVKFSPDVLHELEFVNYRYVDSQDLLDIFLGSPVFNSLGVLYACAEESDWEKQKNTPQEIVPGIWYKAEIPLDKLKIREELRSSLSCFGSVLRKVILLGPPYPGEITLESVLVQSVESVK